MKTAEMRCVNCRHYDTTATLCKFFNEQRDQTYQCEYWQNREMYDYERNGER
jgi:hypothetical protein